MSQALLKLVEEFGESLISGNAALQESILQKLDLATSDYPLVEQSVFEDLLKLLKDERVQKGRNSASLFKYFEYNDDLLNPEQRNVLCETFKVIYPNYIDPSSLILMLELLVSMDVNELGLIAALTEYQQLNDSPANILLPYGLKYLYKHTSNPKIKYHCEKITEHLTKDKGEEVRKEAKRTIDFMQSWSKT